MEMTEVTRMRCVVGPNAPHDREPPLGPWRAGLELAGHSYSGLPHSQNPGPPLLTAVLAEAGVQQTSRPVSVLDLHP